MLPGPHSRKLTTEGSHRAWTKNNSPSPLGGLGLLEIDPALTYFRA